MSELGIICALILIAGLVDPTPHSAEYRGFCALVSSSAAIFFGVMGAT